MPLDPCLDEFGCHRRYFCINRIEKREPEKSALQVSSALSTIALAIPVLVLI